MFLWCNSTGVLVYNWYHFIQVFLRLIFLLPLNTTQVN